MQGPSSKAFEKDLRFASRTVDRLFRGQAALAALPESELKELDRKYSGTARVFEMLLERTTTELLPGADGTAKTTLLFENLDGSKQPVTYDAIATLAATLMLLAAQYWAQSVRVRAELAGRRSKRGEPGDDYQCGRRTRSGR